MTYVRDEYVTTVKLSLSTDVLGFFFIDLKLTEVFNKIVFNPFDDIVTCFFVRYEVVTLASMQVEPTRHIQKNNNFKARGAICFNVNKNKTKKKGKAKFHKSCCSGHLTPSIIRTK